MSVALTPSQFGRGRPLASLALVVGLIVGHHMYGMQQGEIFPKLLIFLFLIGGMAAAGCIYPPVFFALTKYGQHLPTRFKVIGGLCALAGSALGLWVLITFY
jgi:hypothetical protein